MSISINAKTDYSFLFSNLGSSSSGAANLNFLSDYASIKNGSYGKLMKAYFSETSSENHKASNTVKKKTNNMMGTAVSTDDNKTLANVQSKTDALKESADALLVSGSKSLFNKKEITAKDDNGVETTSIDYDKNAIYSAVSSFVNNYNSVVKAADDVNSNSILGRTQIMTNATNANSKLLSKIGITVGSDKTLSLDKDTFMKADMTTVKSLFNGNGSYGYRVSAQASMINYAADNEASKAAFYGENGNYSNPYSSGNIFSSYL